MKQLNYSSHIELDSQYFAENISFIRSLLSDVVTISAVIKANAYGHGIKEFVQLAEANGIHHFSVYGMEETLAFHGSASPKSTLMVMGFIDPENVAWLIEHAYEFFVYDLIQLENVIDVAKRLDAKAKIHLELETGMNRTGLDQAYFEQVIEILNANTSHLLLAGVCTHLAGAESFDNFDRINRQIENFKTYVAHFASQGVVFESQHAACSAGLIRFPEVHFDMVRVGILLYGFWPNKETMIDFLSKSPLQKDPLTSILSWKSKIMTVKNVPAGAYIGYGTSYLANTPTTIGVVPVGYGYGYSRMLSNQGRVLVHGKRVPVIGTVNMNMMMVDITDVAGVKNGDEVVLIGFQKENRITVSSFSEMSSQMNYELLARLPHNIPRIIK